MRSIRFKSICAAVTATSLAATAFGYVGVQSSSAGPSAPSVGSGRALEVQGEIERADLVEKLEASLAGAFAGVWYEPAVALLHVGVTSSDSRRIAEAVAADAGLADEVTETPVESTWAALHAEQERLSRFATAFANGDVTTWLDPEHNSVGVELDSSAPVSRQTALKREIVAAPVAVSLTVAPRLPFAEQKNGCKKFEAGKAYCEGLVGGVTIEAENNAKCTDGGGLILSSRPKPSVATETYVLTAGHCIQEGGGNGKKWYGYKVEEGKPEKTEIGKALEFQNGEIDAGVIKVENAAWVSPGFIPLSPTIADWREETPIPFSVLGQTPSVVGNKTCRSGQTSGTSCGKILKIELEYTWPGGEVSKELTEVNFTGAKGDSGGPYFSETSSGYMEGTEVGRINTGNDVYQPLADSLSKLKTSFQLLSDVNEVRHPQKFLSTLAGSTAITSTADGTGETAHQVIEAGGGKLTCASVSYEGTQSGSEVSELTLSPSYKECTFLGQPTTVSMGGCNYAVHANGEFGIKSKSGKNCGTEPMKWEASKCKIEIFPQGSRELLSFKNIKPGTVEEVTMEMNVSGLSYSATGEGCGKKGEFTDGAYKTGNVILTGAEPGGGAMVNYRWAAE